MLRFDFEFKYRQHTYYIEFDGKEHFDFIPHWHQDNNGFNRARQRDLLKNYITKLDGKKIIRIAYPQVKDISIEDFSKYLLTLLEREEILITDHPLYNDWINLLPEEETLKQYFSI